MNNNIHNICKGKAPPGESRVQSIVQNVFPLLGGNVRRTKGVTCNLQLATCSFFNGTLLLNMRDGPRGRAPATRFAMGYGLVTLIQKSSVSLCVHSASSAVKKFLPQRKQRSHREHRVIYTHNPTTAFRTNCTEDGRLQEEKLERMKDDRLSINNGKSAQAFPFRGQG